MPEEPSFAEHESNFEVPADRDDDFSDESVEEAKKPNNLQDFTFIPGAKENENGASFSEAQAEVDMSKLSSVEQIREYLESELGADKLKKVHPIIKGFGDDILFMDKLQDLKQQLAPYMGGE